MGKSTLKPRGVNLLKKRTKQPEAVKQHEVNPKKDRDSCRTGLRFEERVE